jgi:phage gp36-like protein
MTTTYSTNDRLQLRTGERLILEWAGDAEGVLNLEKLDQARVSGFNLINGKLQARFAQYLPFVGAAIPEVLKDLEDDFAIFWLASTNQQAGEMYIFNYKQALERLKAIASGEEALISNGVNLTEEFVQVSSGLAISNTLNQTPIFTRSVLESEMLR